MNTPKYAQNSVEMETAKSRDVEGVVILSTQMFATAHSETRHAHIKNAGSSTSKGPRRLKEVKETETRTPQIGEENKEMPNKDQIRTQKTANPA